MLLSVSVYLGNLSQVFPGQARLSSRKISGIIGTRISPRRISFQSTNNARELKKLHITSLTKILKTKCTE